ncbi:MAG: hypothetical protein AAF382_05610 [Pseudomonadota bacterium]
MIITACFTLTGLICSAYFAGRLALNKFGLSRPNIIAFVFVFGGVLALNIATHINFTGSATAAIGGAGAATSAGIMLMYVSIAAAAVIAASWHLVNAWRTREITK